MVILPSEISKAICLRSISQKDLLEDYDYNERIESMFIDIQLSFRVSTP